MTHRHVDDILIAGSSHEVILYLCAIYITAKQHGIVHSPCKVELGRPGTPLEMLGFKVHIPFQGDPQEIKLDEEAMKRRKIFPDKQVLVKLGVPRRILQDAKAIIEANGKLTIE